MKKEQFLTLAKFLANKKYRGFVDCFGSRDLEKGFQAAKAIPFESSLAEEISKVEQMKALPAEAQDAEAIMRAEQTAAIIASNIAVQIFASAWAPEDGNPEALPKFVDPNTGNTMCLGIQMLNDKPMPCIRRDSQYNVAGNRLETSFSVTEDRRRPDGTVMSAWVNVGWFKHLLKDEKIIEVYGFNMSVIATNQDNIAKTNAQRVAEGKKPLPNQALDEATWGRNENGKPLQSFWVGWNKANAETAVMWMLAQANLLSGSPYELTAADVPANGYKSGASIQSVLDWLG